MAKKETGKKTVKKFKKPNYKYKTLSEKMDFGQHKDKKVEEVVEAEPLYFEWALKNIKGFSLSNDIKDALKERLGRELKEN